MPRRSILALTIAVVFALPAFAADPPKPATPEEWAKQRHAAIVLDACTRVWETTSEAELALLEVVLATQADSTEKQLPIKMEELRLKSISTEEEYNRLHDEWTKAHGTETQIAAYQRVDIARKIADGLKNDWERLWQMSQLLASVTQFIDKCVKDQRAFLRGEAERPATLYPPIFVTKEVDGIWKASCPDPSGTDKIYAGAFHLTIAPGDLGGNKLSGQIKGSPAGDLELTGFLNTENSAFSASSPNPGASAPNAFILSGRIEDRESDSPEAIGTVLAVVNGVLGCSGEFSRYGNAVPPVKSP